MTILVVDDDATVRSTMAQVLANAGFLVAEASSAPDALIRFGDGKSVDAVILDVNLPNTAGGYWLAWRLRLLRPDLPIVIVSGRSPPSKSELPANVHFLSKPVRGALLVSELRDSIRRMGSAQLA